MENNKTITGQENSLQQILCHCEICKFVECSINLFNNNENESGISYSISSMCFECFPLFSDIIGFPAKTQITDRIT